MCLSDHAEIQPRISIVGPKTQANKAVRQGRQIFPEI